jgi:hypothetical protein
MARISPARAGRIRIALLAALAAGCEKEAPKAERPAPPVSVIEAPRPALGANPG